MGIRVPEGQHFYIEMIDYLGLTNHFNICIEMILRIYFTKGVGWRVLSSIGICIFESWDLQVIKYQRLNLKILTDLFLHL